MSVCTLRRWYVIYRLLTDHPERAILYTADISPGVYAIFPSGDHRVWKAVKANLESCYDDPRILGANPVLILDSLVEAPPAFPVVLISSPGRLRNRDHKDVLNRYRWHCCMPLPTEEEVLSMWRAAFSDQSEEGVRARMRLWGPVPRLVLVNTSQHYQRQRWADVKSCSIERIVAAARGVVLERAAGQDDAPGTRTADPASDL